MHQGQKHMFDKNKITFKLDGRDLLCSAKSIEEVKKFATMLKKEALDQQDYEQAALFRDIENHPEIFPIGV